MLLDRTRQLLADSRYAEAAQCLDRILGGSEDFFFRADTETSVHRSVKSEARRLLGSFPAAGRQSYELQFGALARSSLGRAVEAGDMTSVAEVARRFFHTEAGYEANFLLGLHHLDHGRPLVAALTLRRLRDESTNPARFEPALSLAMARGWLDAGMPEDARESLETLRRRYSEGAVTIEGRQVPLFKAGDDSVKWLLTATGPGSSEISMQPGDWTMHGGSPQRTGFCEGGRPLLNPRWYVRGTDHPAVEAMIDQLERQQQDREMPLLPGLYPLAVGDVVLMRTVTNLLAVDFRTGKRLWEVPAADPFEAAMNPAPEGYVNGHPNLESGLRLRLWGDEAFGTLSSDGRLVFAVEDLQLPTTPIYSRVLLAPGNAGTTSHALMTSNRLAALEIRSQGKLRWELGGAHSDHPLPLAGAFFLGPPLPLLGDLYVLAEIEGEIRLLALRAETGELLWQQQLAVVEQSVFQDTLRRVSGVSPSYGDGILVCPTSHRSVVALDLTTRSLLWGYSYGEFEQEDQRRPGLFEMARQRTANPENRWTDWVAMIAEGRVLVAPPDSNQLHCLDLHDGKLLWRVPREDKLFIAAVTRDNVVVAGRRGLAALDLESGVAAWEAALFVSAPGAEPSGRGFSDGELYYLPLTDGKLMAVRLATGQVEQVIRPRGGRALGNLVCHGGRILSQRADGIEAYDQLAALRAEVDGRLVAEPGDPVALALRGEILWDDGKLDEAVESLRKSLQAADSVHARALLRDVMFDGLERDFAGYQDRRDEIESLLETVEDRAALHRLMAIGWENAAQYERALAEYRALVDLDLQESGFVKAGADYWVRNDRWIQARLRALYEAAPEDIRLQLVRWSEEVLAGSQAGGKGNEGALLGYFEGLPQTRPHKMAWIERLLKAGRATEAELAMMSEIRATEGEARGELLSRWTGMLLETGRPSDAAALLSEIQNRWAELPFPGGKNGRTWAAEFTAGHEAVRLAGTPALWPAGYVRSAVKETESGRVGLGYGRGYLPLVGGERSFFDDLVLEYQQQQIVARDGFGQVRWQFPLSEIAEMEQLAFSRGLMRLGACGHLLILSLGDRVVALDTLRTRSDGTPTVAWSESVEGAERAALERYMFLPSIRNAPGWLDGGGFLGGAGYALDSGLVLGGSLVCIKRSRACAALDPASGQTLWKRDGISSQSMIFGDDDYVLVAPRQSTEATVYRAGDGTEVGSRRIPPEEQRVATSGRRILCWEPSERGYDLKMVDPLSPEKDGLAWGPYSFPLEARPQVIEGNAVAVFTPEGKFRLIRLADGKSIVDTQLDLEQPMTDMVVRRGAGRYLVVANSGANPRDPRRHIAQVTGVKAHPIGSAKVYAFDDRGTALWEKPALVEDQFLPLMQPRDVPCLTFVCAVHDMTPGQPQQAKISVLCLDTRNGQIVARRDFTHGGNMLEIAALPEESSVEIRMQQETLRLEFTGQPVPEGGYSEAEEVPSDPLKAIWHAVLKGMATPGEGLGSKSPPARSLPPSAGPGNPPEAQDAKGEGGNLDRPRPLSRDGAIPAPAAKGARPTGLVLPPPLEPAIRDRIPPPDSVPSR
ncbi:MAG: outer membrane protein assembly factor BamB family protein [Thermoguttaceae bacterium]